MEQVHILLQRIQMVLQSLFLKNSEIKISECDNYNLIILSFSIFRTQ
jgi:hypothetical protein